ncbi:MAG: sulfotransferase family protein [Mesorhizobium sp.]|nr:MAG: sulfotransferase family protein [Mesorhizobium sp.]TIV25136.1 MAG: sulfotransferase family protein [Mesorhizobium sp.]TIV67937.1 MAG: sulfotransferase family protein [Mesorhizobium sp.]TIW05650.1 MAG: sulfotransferase family protein [Mesorhizobium sp.]
MKALANLLRKPALEDLRNLKNPIAFVHIPKTAGTAFVEYLITNIGNPSKVAPPFMGDMTVTQDEQNSYDLYWGHYDYFLLKATGRQFTFVTFLRHPLARAISQWKSWSNPGNLTDAWLAVMEPYQVEALRFSQKATLDEFIMSPNLYIEGHIRDVQTRYLADAPDKPGMLDSAKRNLRDVFRFFGIVERFDDSIRLFQANFRNALPYAVPAARENKSRESDTRISQAAQDRLRALNANDFELYDFGCKLFEQRFRKTLGG